MARVLPSRIRRAACQGHATTDRVDLSRATSKTPRATAHRVPDEQQRTALYDAMRGYEVETQGTVDVPKSSGLAERARALRRPRAFDPEARPSTRRSEHVVLGRDEIEDLQEKAQHGHHAILVRLERALTSRGWTDLVEIPLAIDLRGRTLAGATVIFEAKTITADNETRQCRSALAQLLEYRQEYGSPEDALCLVVDRAVSERRADLLDRLGIAAVLLGPDTVARGLNPAGDELVAEG
ncbi:MAG: hypothetical protein M3469_02440 [Actinomycetota bacterium]|nr:hypothetical protein [Actinomycetota bacterium]